MMVDNDVSDENEHSADHIDETVAQVSGAAACSMGSEVASTMMDATEAMAQEAQSANGEATEMLSTASADTAQAFDAARQHLKTMWSSLPGGSQGALVQVETAAEAFGKSAEANYSTTLQRMAEFNGKAIAAWRSNAESTTQHWRTLASVKSLSDAISLNAEHTRRQMDAFREQTQELSTLATRIVRDAANPLKFSCR